MPTNTRCEWARHSESEAAYHDHEWGVPLHDDQLLFEFLILEGAQAGLSWSTILNKRDNYREAFDQFDVAKVARYSEKKVEKLLTNPGIVRNRLKVNSAVINAKAFIEIQKEFGSFDHYIWSFVNHKPIQNKWRSLSDIPATTEISDSMAKALKKLGL